MKKLLLGLTLLGSSAFAELPTVANAHIPQPPPGAPVAGGYLTLNNPSDEALVLTGVSSDDVPRVEIHRSEIIDDVATMSKIDEILVEAGGAVELKHGSYHLMLMGLQEQLQPGDTITVTLESSAGPIDVVLTVTAPGHARHKH